MTVSQARTGSTKIKILSAVFAAALLGSAHVAWAGPVFFGPVHYESSLNIPTGFYDGGSPTFLEDFEDGSLDGGIAASAGSAIPPGWTGLIDSVDGDDGTIDGWSAQDGTAHSWFYGSGVTGVMLTFENPVTAAGVVWTDGAGTTTFKAYRGATMLGFVSANVATPGHAGQTNEDSFFGVQDMEGITAIWLGNSSGGIELDHVQYGDAAMAPEPTSLAILGLGLAGIGFSRRKRLS